MRGYTTLGVMDDSYTTMSGPGYPSMFPRGLLTSAQMMRDICVYYLEVFIQTRGSITCSWPICPLTRHYSNTNAVMSVLEEGPLCHLLRHCIVTVSVAIVTASVAIVTGYVAIGLYSRYNKRGSFADHS